MEKGLMYLVMVFLGVWLILDDFWGGRKVSRLVQQFGLPDLPSLSEILGGPKTITDVITDRDNVFKGPLPRPDRVDSTPSSGTGGSGFPVGLPSKD